MVLWELNEQAHFTKKSIVIQIGSKFNDAWSQIKMKQLLQIFAYDTTAVLSGHVQTFVVTWFPEI